MRSHILTLRLKEQIEALKGGVTTAANHLGKSRNTIYNWIEKGNAPLDQVEKLAEIGVDIIYVATGFTLRELKELPVSTVPGKIGETTKSYQDKNANQEIKAAALNDQLNTIVDDYIRDDTLQLIITAIDQALHDKNITLDARRRTQLIAAARNGYEQLVPDERTVKFSRLLNMLIDATLAE